MTLASLKRVRALLGQIDRFRDWVNSGEEGQIKEQLLKDSEAWLSTCVSMDFFEDTLEAISHYLIHGLGSSGGNRAFHAVGGRYLKLYGVFQAINLHQDAVIDLYERFAKKKLLVPTAWDRIRRLRVCIAGHPQDADREGPTFVSRPELGPRHFRYHYYKNGADTVSEIINVDSVIDDYLAEATSIMADLIQEMKIE